MIEVALDDRRNRALRDPDAMLRYIDGRMQDNGDYYIILDEVQYMDEFEDMLNSLLHIPNADVYVTGSNSKFLSSDVITEFRGRGDEIHVYPLCFREYASAYAGTPDEAWDDYVVYGGLPLILSMEMPEDKAEYLFSLFQKVYLSDMENIIYNELRIRGYHVDVGVIEHYDRNKAGKREKKQLEVDFVATMGSEKYYIQSAFAMPTTDKIDQEQRSLLSISDSFRKIIVVGRNQKVRRDENGIATIGLRNFLLDENSLRL